METLGCPEVGVDDEFIETSVSLCWDRISERSLMVEPLRLLAYRCFRLAVQEDALAIHLDSC